MNSMVPAHEPPCVLLVDDNPMVLLAMSMLLGSLGWEVSKAQNAPQAIEHFKWKNYDLAILDLRMPETNGIELCRQIRSVTQGRTPIIFIHSGYIDENARKDALKTGVHHILDKPVGREEIIDALKKFGLPSTP